MVGQGDLGLKKIEGGNLIEETISVMLVCNNDVRSRWVWIIRNLKCR
jgi:hypothetical protein